ncbi:MAG: NAD-dependent epimerase/dehydratase family protein, partial [Planctomycetota bacterium]
RMKVLVTGGGGFLGSAIVRRLVERGDEVTSFSRSYYQSLADLGVRQVRGYLGEEADVMRALEGAELCFHVAAKAGIWGPAEEYERTNVRGTRNVVAGCIEHDVKRLVLTSSPSVCFSGDDHVNASNDLPYARDYHCDYPRTKAESEKFVLASNGRRELATCALRPHLIFGPGDPHLLPRLVQRAKERKLRIVGSGKNEVTLCYVENAAHAHLLAGDALHLEAKHAGRAYFIGQEQPVALWPWVGELLQRVGAPPLPKLRVPEGLARFLGAQLEKRWRARDLPGEPPMTRFVAAQLARSHSYDMTPAKQDFGYSEIVSMEEAISRAIEDLSRRAMD